MELVDLHCAIVQHVHDTLGTSASLDLSTIRSRSLNEGESFFTLTLPALGKTLEKSIEQGKLCRDDYPLFKVRNRHDIRPQLFWSLWSRVFSDEGELLATVDPYAVKGLRQCLLVFEKIFTLPDDSIIEASLQQYVLTDSELTVSWDPDQIRQLSAAFSVLFPNLDSISKNLIPRHGAGAVAEKIPQNSRYRQRGWTDRLERYFPSSDFIIPSYRYWQELGDDLLDPGSEPPIRVGVVPKTAKAARVIGMEPWHMQYVQQALFRNFSLYLRNHPVCSYKSQEPNQLLARRGSEDRSYSTLDLSEASDRVHLSLVVELFKRHPLLLGEMLACRSQRSELPNGEIILLRKFASMGSALTFPIESMVFSAIAFLGICLARKLPITRNSWRAIGTFRVFGDDIIVPEDSTLTVIELLETFGLKVNQSKSFTKSLFRESCGADWYAGVDVTLVRLRQHFPQSRREAKQLASIVAFRNLFTEMWGPGELTSTLDNAIERLIPFPAGYPDTPCLCRSTSFDTVVPEGTHKRLQRGTVSGCTLEYTYPRDELDGSGALLKYFLSKEGIEEGCEWSKPAFAGEDHLTFAGRPKTTRVVFRKDIPLTG